MPLRKEFVSRLSLKFIELRLLKSFHLYEPVRGINKYPNSLSVVTEDQRLLGIYHFNTSVFACSVITSQNSMPQNENAVTFHSTSCQSKLLWGRYENQIHRKFAPVVPSQPSLKLWTEPLFYSMRILISITLFCTHLYWVFEICF